ncbi:MAG: DUF805 domain-containing protein [Rhodobacter sp.]|jgi:uncharacterized membrane protein YhaH (DUF805 family)|nr:DUF805 domain-containing protein [Rhodobacter sp.]MCA3487009.1 DUF805 domain-containing protein [Rhodobacter sp.]MCA3493899.1 DUF805 domain-containing protein [Rhodobacter sp.]MCA3499554.1 DUF805 domain-containing protein [Rhodobacter sp.]MCA3503801.1 DUF805 domain-containing protein [Rhodobacter sp.]
MPEGKGLSVINLVLKGFRNIFRIAGRSNRREYVPFAVLILLSWVAYYYGHRAMNAWYLRSIINGADSDAVYERMVQFQRLSWIVFLIIPMFSFTVIARRLHDIGYSARWAVAMYLAPVLAILIPLAIAMASFLIWPKTGLSDDGRGIGSAIIAVYLFLASLAVNFFVVLVLCFWPSQPGPNRYGPNPNEVSQ